MEHTQNFSRTQIRAFQIWARSCPRATFRTLYVRDSSRFPFNGRSVSSQGWKTV